MKLVRALSNLKIVVILTSLIFTACLREQKEAPLAQRSGYVGCLDAVSTGKDSIQVTVNMPSQATEVQVFRNNTMVGSVFPGDSQNNTFNDTLLPVQGEVYKYSCKAITPSEDLVGYNEPTVKTTPEDAPTFNGLETVTIENNIHAKLTWKSPASTGAKVTKYLVYANMNRATGSVAPNVDFTKDPIATISAPAKEYTVTNGLGDKIPYVFSVIACTYNDICAGSDVYKTAATNDNGKPETTGISNIETLSGGIKVTAPWDESMGETTKRVLYMGTSNSTNLADYTQIRAYNISSSNLKDQSFMADMTTFEVVDSRIEENTLYYFALVDQDSNGNTSEVIPYQLQTYDLTPPSFTGITDISPNSLQPSTAMDISFPASNSEGAPDYDNTGASSYVVEYTKTPYVDGSTTWPADPCSDSGIRHSTTYSANPGGVAGGTGVTITVNGLSPRTFYRFCVRAKDAYGNESGDLSTSVTIPVATLDSTPPIFDGIQGLSGVTPGGVYKIKVDWNKASDLYSNVKYYQLKIWSNTADSSAASDLTTVNRSASNSSYDNGTLIANGTDFDYGQGTRVYVLVNACDDADSIPDGSINCTNYDDSLAMSIIPPDIEPPQNFTGISDATSTVSNGVATLSWYEPTPWSSDYFGFRVYNSVYNSGTSSYDLTLLKSCNCASPGSCVSPTDLSCDVGNLDANREYRFHIRAVDAAGNETQTNPQVSWEAVTIKDGNPPNFTPNLAGEWSVADQAIKLTWTEATDNQYTGDITYEIFRHQPGQSDFTAGEISNPTGSPRATVANVSEYIDTDSNYATVGGGDYYYLICAKDAQDNRTCASSSLNVFLPDIRPPDILTELQSDKSTDSNNLLRLWDLSFKVTDNNTRLERLDVKVYSTFTDSAEVPAEVSGNLDADGNSDSNRTDDTGTDYITISNLRGKAQQSGYVNYKVVVTDEYGNKSSKTASYTFDAKITISSIAADKANKDLTKQVVIQGSGFSKGTENGTGVDTQILLGSEVCTNVNIYNSTVLTCDTPSGVSGGLVNVSIVNPDNAQDTISGGFTFTDGTTFPHAICDTQAAQDATPFATGFGTQSEPYIICNQTQFDNMATYNTNYFKLGSHLEGSTISGEIDNFTGGFDGAGYMIYNRGGDYNLFARIKGSSYIKNLVMFNNSADKYRALLVGVVEGGTISNIGLVNNNIIKGHEPRVNPVIGGLLYTTDPITIENINWTTQDLTLNYFTNPLFGSANGYDAGDAPITLSNITINSKIVFDYYSDITMYVFKGFKHVNIDNLNINFELDHTDAYDGIFIYFFDDLSNWNTSTGFNQTQTDQGVGKFEDININVSGNKIERFWFVESIYLKENTIAKNINVDFSTSYTGGGYGFGVPIELFQNVYLNRGSGFKNLTYDIRVNTDEIQPTAPFNYVEYDSRTTGGDPIIFENIKSDSSKYFIGRLLPTSGPAASSPSNMQPIQFSKIKSLGSLIHILDTKEAGTYSDLSVPAIEIENCELYPTTSYLPIITAVSDYVTNNDYKFVAGYGFNPSNILPISSSDTTWKTPGIQPYVKLTNTAIVYSDPTSIPDYLISKLGDTSDTVVNATYEAICNGSGSSGNFYSNQIPNLTDNSSHTTCAAITAESDTNLKDTSTGNVLDSAGWDFDNIWQYNSTTGFPELR